MLRIAKPLRLVAPAIDVLTESGVADAWGCRGMSRSLVYAGVHLGSVQDTLMAPRGQIAGSWSQSTVKAALSKPEPALACLLWSAVTRRTVNAAIGPTLRPCRTAGDRHHEDDAQVREVCISRWPPFRRGPGRVDADRIRTDRMRRERRGHAAGTGRRADRGLRRDRLGHLPGAGRGNDPREAGRAARHRDRRRPAQHPDPQNRRDNATPWEGGTGLHKALRGSSAFVGVDNGGHYVYDVGSACADKATVGFLTTGHLPRKDVYCTDVEPEEVIR